MEIMKINTNTYINKIKNTRRSIHDISINNIMSELEAEVSEKYKVHSYTTNEIIINVGKNKKGIDYEEEITDYVKDYVSSKGDIDFDILFKVVAFKNFVTIRLKRTIQ